MGALFKALENLAKTHPRLAAFLWVMVGVFGAAFLVVLTYGSYVGATNGEPRMWVTFWMGIFFLVAAAIMWSPIPDWWIQRREKRLMNSIKSGVRRR